MNDMGISPTLDWPRIKHLYKIGIFGALLNAAGDMLLGAHAADESLSGLEMMLAAYIQTSGTGLFWSAALGMVGVALMELSLFAVYRLMAGASPRHAHAYRAGILGCVITGPCGFHVGVVAGVYSYKCMYELSPQAALSFVQKYMLYFILPATALFFVFYIVLCAVQLSAFIKGFTPYPKWCAVFSPLCSVLVYLAFSPFDSSPLANGAATAWLSLGHLFMFAGLLATAGKAEKKCC